MSIPVQNFPRHEYLGKPLSVHTSLDLSVNPSGRLSVTLSPSAENLSKFPSNNQENHVVNYLHEIPVISPPIHTSCIMSVIAPIHDCPFCPSICQAMNIRKSQTNSPVLIMGKNLSKIMTKFPNNVTLTLHNVKFPEKTPGATNGAKYLANFPLT